MTFGKVEQVQVTLISTHGLTWLRRKHISFLTSMLSGDVKFSILHAAIFEVPGWNLQLS